MLFCFLFLFLFWRESGRDGACGRACRVGDVLGCVGRILSFAIRVITKVPAWPLEFADFYVLADSASS
jgi:hypothetical protein